MENHCDEAGRIRHAFLGTLELVKTALIYLYDYRDGVNYSRYFQPTPESINMDWEVFTSFLRAKDTHGEIASSKFLKAMTSYDLPPSGFPPDHQTCANARASANKVNIKGTEIDPTFNGLAMIYPSVFNFVDLDIGSDKRCDQFPDWASDAMSDTSTLFLHEFLHWTTLVETALQPVYDPLEGRWAEIVDFNGLGTYYTGCDPKDGCEFSKPQFDL
jgi:hypothetical protein